MNNDAPASRPILSVIIVTYNSAAEIDACLESIPERLFGQEVELIVVDNASADGTEALIRKRFRTVRLLRQDRNIGFGRANNLGYEHSVGDFVLFLNPDTVSNEPAYSHCLGRLLREPEIGIISSRLATSDGSMDLACRRSIPTIWDGFARATGLAARFPRIPFFSGYNLTHLPENESYEVGAVNGAFMMCPRRALLRFGVFDEQFFMYGDDLDLCLRCRKAGYKVVYDGRCQITHLKGMSSSKTGARMTREVFNGTKQFYLKHFNPHGSAMTKAKYEFLFWAWQTLAMTKAKLRGYNKARPL